MKEVEVEVEEVVEKEMIIQDSPRTISKQGTRKILEQMEKCICKIIRKDGNKGTGFFCKINYNKKDIPIMVTNFHIIDDQYIKENEKIDITINDDEESKKLKFKDRKIYTNKEYDITIIELKEKDNIKDYLKMDEKYLNDDSEKIYDKSIYIIQYPKGDQAAVSYGLITNLKNYNLEYNCNTDSGSSGSPIINIVNNEIIGVHKEGIIRRRVNRGTLLKYPIKDFIKTILKNNEKVNEIEIKVDVEEEDINNDIYFLDNTDYEDENKVKHYHDNLKELNELNAELYINNNKCEFKKYFKPENEGEYEIKLKFINIRDCSFMFAGCKNITSINFTKFNTKNAKYMKYMFSGCVNIKKLDLSIFNTENVTSMEGMFGQFDNLYHI